MAKKKKKRKGPNVGVALFPSRIEVLTYDMKKGDVTSFESFPIPDGVLNESGDRINDEEAFVKVLQSTLGKMRNKPKAVNLSITGTLLRLVEMPKMDPKALFLSLSSEAERYKAFDGTEAVVDFDVLEGDDRVSANMQRVVFGAVRQDYFHSLRKAFATIKIKLANVDLEPIHVLRAMAGSHVLDSLLDQIGDDSFWGALFVEDERIRFSVWQGNNLVELREVSMDTRDFATADPDAPFSADVAEEIQRTSKNAVPSIWLTYNLSEQMNREVSEKLGVPLRACLPGPSVNLGEHDASLPALGAAMASTVDYPFDYNFLTGVAGVSSGKKEVEVEEEASGPGMGLLFAGVGSLILLSLLVWGGLFLFSILMQGSELTALETSEQEKLQLVTSKTAERDSMKQRYDLRGQVVDIMETAQRQNALQLSLVNDLKKMTPSDVWLYKIKADGGLSVEGKAMSHQGVLNLANRFDGLFYAKEMLIDSIHEEMGRYNQKFYRFEINGRTELDERLVRKPEPEVSGSVNSAGKSTDSADIDGETLEALE